MRKLLEVQGRVPRVMVTDKLRSYGAAKREVMPGVEHRSHKGLKNRAENSRFVRVEEMMKSDNWIASFLVLGVDQYLNNFTGGSLH